jgi:hypothetical protein
VNRGLLGFPLGRGLGAGTVFGFPLGGREERDYSEPPASGLYAWWDCSLVSSITVSGSNMTGWADRSGNGNNMSQGTVSNAPFYGARTLNGVTVCEFQAAQDWMDSGVGGTFLASRDWTIFGVGLNDNNANFRSMFVGSTATAGLQLAFNSSGQLCVRLDDGSTLATNTSVSVGGGTGWCCGVRATPSTWSLRMNGVQTEHSEATAPSSSSSFRMGGDDVLSASYRHDGLFAECVLYDRYLSDYEMYQTEQYLRSKWAV